MANKAALWAAVCGFGLLATVTGCQSSIGGQTLPSANYLSDDVQFYRPAPQIPLFNQRQAIEQYRVNQEAAANGGANQQPPAPAP